MNKLHIIGLGIEGRESLSRRALRLIEMSDILIGGRRHLACFPEFKGEKVPIKSDLKEIAEFVERRSEEKVVILASGDPAFFGIAAPLIKIFGKDNFEIIPNVSAMQAAFSRIKESWHDVRFVSLHGRDRREQDDGLLNGVVRDIVNYQKVGIFTDSVNSPSKIASVVLDAGIDDYHVYVCEDLGTEKEKITDGSLQETTAKSFSSLNVMILIRSQESEDRDFKLLESGKENLSSAICSGIPDNLFSHERGMITKEEVRVIALSKLQLKSNSILWDIGAGSGSLSIEAALQMDKGKVFAIERDIEMVRHIEENKKRFRAINLKIVNKEAPSCLKGIPGPDAVFIGGSGRKILGIMKVSSERLRREGRFVINAVSLETLSEVTGFLSGTGWHFEVISVNISKTKELNDLHIFNACNPVFIIVTGRP